MSWANPRKNSAAQRREVAAGACAFVAAMTSVLTRGVVPRGSFARRPDDHKTLATQTL